jgi:hypothetical protein
MGGGGGDDSAKKAAREQTKALQMQINEQRQAYADAQGLLGQFSQAGQGGLQSYLALLGQSGPQAQQAAISGLQQTPGYQAQLQAGQRAILQNAAATGGLRGGNVQQGLAEFGSGLFGNYYQQQLDRLGMLQSQGLQTQSALANIRQGAAAQIGNTYANIGDAKAQGILAQQAAQQEQQSDMLGGLGGLAGMFGGGGGGTKGKKGGSGGMLSGAASGAAAGAAFGPWGAAAGGILGALGGK